MSLRNYNKLYVHTDREEGSEKLLLGYQNDVREIILAKDTETIFHVPYYTNPISLAESTLISDGATPGPFPAASDRIFKNRKNYGNISANGTGSDIADGVWFCSWLYKDEYGNVRWMDRYYNPGHLIISVAIAQLTEKQIYKKNDPVYRDVPSTMLLEPGVQYRYFHVGEKTAKEIVDTFQGSTGNRLRLNLTGWGTDTIDTSLSANSVRISTNAPDNSNLYDVTLETDRVSASMVNFNNPYSTEISVDYNSSYALTDEFSLSFWAQSDDWNGCQTTQLVGNFSSNGGVGVFIDTLSSYPFFVIPETGYGHLVYLNEVYAPYLDKSLQITSSLTATPQFVAIDSDHNVIVSYADSSKRINKFDNAGKLLATTSLQKPEETPQQLLCGANDDVIVITNKARYTYDANLNLKNTTLWETLTSTVAAFAYNLELGTSELISTNNVYDSKFTDTTHWILSANDGNLYRKHSGQTSYELFTEFDDIGTNFAIDPHERIWVLHGTNNVSVYDSQGEAFSDPLFVFDAGPNVAHDQKNISFTCTFNRSTNTREWRCLIYHGDKGDALNTPQLYAFDLSGNLIQTIDLLSILNRNLTSTLSQQQKYIQFSGKGDFTGYERRRVFNKLPPFNNNSQLVIRASLKDKLKTDLGFTQLKTYVPINKWNNQSWQHILLVLQNRVFRLYINGNLFSETSYTGQYEVSYELQPPFFVGSPVGSQYGFNQEIGNTTAIFNGKFQDIKIYDYALDPKNLNLFQLAATPAQNIYWSLPTPSIQYIEKIERMFKNKIPGAKATFFNVKLCGTQITDTQTRVIIEEEIRNMVEKIKPVYANLLNIIWVD
jgi:hypothetical protein